jgi:hypothetical protein
MSRTAEVPLARATIQLEKRMTSIESSPTETGNTRARAADGEEQGFDEVVVTCPLGWGSYCNFQVGMTDAATKAWKP